MNVRQQQRKRSSLVLSRGQNGAYRAVRRTEKEVRKELKATERTIAQLDAKRKELMDQFMATNDSKISLRLESEMNAVGEELSAAEDLWAHLNDEVNDLE